MARAQKAIMTWAAMRRVKYNTLSFYRRRLEAMTDILIEKGIVSRTELDRAIEAGKVRWSDLDEKL
jgi:hypothetical protein